MSDLYAAAQAAQIAMQTAPKAVEVEVTVRFSDGARTIVRYVPEPGEGLRTTIQARDPEVEAPLGTAAGRLVAFHGSPDRHTIEVRDAAQVEFEHLVRHH